MHPKQTSHSKADKSNPGVSFSPMVLMMTQLLPLIVFVVVDALVTDVRISILSAVIFAIGQLAVTFIHSRRFEWIVLVDVGLIVVLGGISIVSKNDLFFKVKPAIMEGLAVLFFVGLLFAKDAFLQRYFERFTPGRTMTPKMLHAMRTMIKVLCGSTLVHIAVVCYTAFYASKETWAMVSGPGFYLTVLPVLAVIAVKARRNRQR